MAPSKRADNKGNITIYIDRKIIAKFREVCAFFGIPMSVIITSFMEHKIKEYFP
jgi:antitoxin component of RelBE/YafQ-DinJ toxin-antitoxin module